MRLSKKNFYPTCIIFVIFIWGTGFRDLIPSILINIFSLILYSVCLFYAFINWTKRFRRIDLLISLLTIVFPIIASIQALQVFGQPFWMGLISLRSLWIILLVYYLKDRLNPQRILDKLSELTLYTIILNFILLYCFNIDNTKLAGLIGTADNDLVNIGNVAVNELKGAKLSFGCEFWFISMSWWSANYFLFKRNIFLKKMIVMLIFSLFVSKGRIQIITLIIIWILPFLSNINKRNFIKLLRYAIIGIISLIALPQVRQRFLVVGDLLGLSDSSSTGDFSGVARLKEILLVLPYIKENWLLGSGNISYHYNGGFIGCLGDYLFIADIGIVGMLFVGGVFLCWVYFKLFFECKNNNRYSDKIGLFVKVCSYIFIIIPFFGLVPIMGGNMQIMTLLLVSNFSKKINNVSNQLVPTNGRKYNYS